MSAFLRFVHDTRFEQLPATVRALMQRSVLDIIGVAAVGSTTDIGRIARTLARRQWAAAADAPAARLMFDGTSVSLAGAAFAGAFMIDAIDGHDGHSPVKGHAGSGVFPALLAFAQERHRQGRPLSGPEFLAAMAVGYEVAYRAGLALHATTTDYHTSGAWTALGAAAVGARLLGLSDEQTRHALGIAEYHGPRSQMMRCIDHPSMLRDGVGWGSPAGVMAVCMAELGFTGAPAITVEREDAAPFWSDLGQRWEVVNTHYKRYPVCRWAHPAIDAAHDLMSTHRLAAADVQRVRIQTFHNATRLAGHDPGNLDEVTYGIAFPTAIMIVRGTIGIAELSPAVLADPEIRRLSLATELVETGHYNRISVRERWADVTLYLEDGRVLQSEPRKPKGDPDDPLDDAEIETKFRRFATPVVGTARVEALLRAVASMHRPDASMDWLDPLLCASPLANADAGEKRAAEA